MCPREIDRPRARRHFGCAAGADAGDPAVLDDSASDPRAAAAPVPSTTRTLVSATDVSGTRHVLAHIVRQRGEGLRGRAPTGEIRRQRAGDLGHGVTSNTIRIPVSMCSATWQCSIHLPGFVTSSSTSADEARRQQHRIFPDEVVVRHPIHRQHQESLAVNVNGVLHGVQRAAIVDQPKLDHVADAESPVDVHVLAAGRRRRAAATGRSCPSRPSPSRASSRSTRPGCGRPIRG